MSRMQTLMFDRDVFMWEHEGNRHALFINAITNNGRLRDTRATESGYIEYGDDEACVLAMSDPRHPALGDINGDLGKFLAKILLKKVGFAYVKEKIETEGAKKYAAQRFIGELENTKIPTCEQLNTVDTLLYHDVRVRPLWSHECQAHVLGMTPTNVNQAFINIRAGKVLDGRIDTHLIGYVLVFKDRLQEVLDDDPLRENFDETCWWVQADTKSTEELELLSMARSNEVFDAMLMTAAADAPWSGAPDWPAQFVSGRYYGHDIYKSGLIKSVGHGFTEAIAAGTFQKGYAKPIEVRTSILIE